MSFEQTHEGGLDYLPCRYGRSKLLFRGPRRDLRQPYIAALGGSETFGKFVGQPWPALAENALGKPVVNFGYLNAGCDVFVDEPTIIEACDGAQATVVQLLGAQSMSNRFYAVHPRRNDRFLRASTLMKTIFREVDFTEFHFTTHMLVQLRSFYKEKFDIVTDELRVSWVARMRSLLQKIEGNTVLLWLTGPSVTDAAGELFGPEPMFVDQEMVDAISQYVAEVVKVTPSEAARAEGTTGMVFNHTEAASAAALPGPRAHGEIAAALVPVLQSML